VHRVKKVEYLEVSKRLPQGVRARVISRLEVAREISEGLAPLNTSKGDES
jgi:hypothetical protein